MMGHHIVYHEPLRYVLHINYKCIVLFLRSTFLSGSMCELLLLIVVV